jgi:hypothetical protein
MLAVQTRLEFLYHDAVTSWILDGSLLVIGFCLVRGRILERLRGRHLAAMLTISSSDTRIRGPVLYRHSSGQRIISRRGVRVLWDNGLCSRESRSVMLSKY